MAKTITLYVVKWQIGDVLRVAYRSDDLSEVRERARYIKEACRKEPRIFRVETTETETEIETPETTKGGE